MSTTIQPQDNLILSALPPSDLDRINSRLEPIELKHSAVIYRPDDVVEYVYFPTSSMVSLINQLSDGSSVETGVTGYEGLVGIESTSNRKDDSQLSLGNCSKPYRRVRTVCINFRVNQSLECGRVSAEGNQGDSPATNPCRFRSK